MRKIRGSGWKTETMEYSTLSQTNRWTIDRIFQALNTRMNNFPSTKFSIWQTVWISEFEFHVSIFGNSEFWYSGNCHSGIWSLGKRYLCIQCLGNSYSGFWIRKMQRQPYWLVLQTQAVFPLMRNCPQNGEFCGNSAKMPKFAAFCRFFLSNF